jgi:putative nucleotidyltransferase with HDIG domain
MAAKNGETTNGSREINWRRAGKLAASAGALVVSMLAITWVVYEVGTDSVAIHLYYLPMIYAGYAFGDFGAIITALLAGALTAWGAPARFGDDGPVAQATYFPIVRAAMFFIVAVVFSRAASELRRRAREFRMLYEVARSITSTLRLREVLNLIVQKAASVIDVQGCSIRLYRPETDELEMVAVEGLSEQYRAKGPVHLEASRVDQQAMAGRPVQVQDVARTGLFQYPDAVRDERIDSVLTVPLRAKNQVRGVIRVYSTHRRRFREREIELVTAFANQAGVAIENAELYEDIRRNYYETVRSLTSAIEARDRATFSHSERVTHLTVGLAEEMGLSAEEIELVQFGAMLHDIGKIGLEGESGGIPGSARDVFFRMHPLIGASILQPVTFLQPVLSIVSGHHERWDGSGFPEGLEGKNIPFHARLAALANEYDRLLYPLLPGDEPMDPDGAIEEITAGANKAFDPEVVAAFRRLMHREPELAQVGAVETPGVPQGPPDSELDALREEGGNGK